eukprot:6502317-Alexandrium_andersonii.AAC.1
MLASPAARSKLSNRARRSSTERGALRSGGCPRLGAAHARGCASFKQPAAWPRSSSMDWAMLTRVGARSTGGRGGGAAASCGTRGITCGWP